MVVDFTGTSPCSRKGVNVPINYTTAIPIRAALHRRPGYPQQRGLAGTFSGVSAAGHDSLGSHPAPVAMRHIIGHLTSDLVIGCLDQALPGGFPPKAVR